MACLVGVMLVMDLPFSILEMMISALSSETQKRLHGVAAILAATSGRLMFPITEMIS